MSKKVLILGNGISRKNHMDFVKSWDDEIWGCNWVFKERISGELHRLDRLLGDYKALIQAQDAKNQYGFEYEIIHKDTPKSLQHFPEASAISDYGMQRKDVADSGSALVRLALKEGYDEVYLVGFDLGGQDIYIKDHEKRNKSSWVRSWRKIAQEFGLDRIHFVGYDHSEYITSNLPDNYYAEFYTRGMNHTSYSPLKDVKIHDDVMIIENGATRNKYIRHIQDWHGEIWVCNEGFKEYNIYGKIHRVGAIKQSKVIEAIRYKKKKGLEYNVYTREYFPGYETELRLFKERQGWFEGPLLVAQSLIENYKNVYLLGFDLGKEDLYGKKYLKSSNYINQLLSLKQKYSSKFKEKVHLLGEEDLKRLLL